MITRFSAHAVRNLSLRNKQGRRSYTHLSQPIYKAEQQGVAEAQRKSGGWAIPAALVLVGLGFSTFSTHQLVSGSESIKMLSSFAKK